MSQSLAHASLNEWSFKTDAMSEMVFNVLTIALGKTEFSALDLPTRGEAAQGGSGIAGSVIHYLLKDEILAPVGTFDDAGEFCPKVKRNEGGNKIGVYRVKNPALARTLLERHTKAPTAKHEQLTLI